MKTRSGLEYRENEKFKIEEEYRQLARDFIIWKQNFINLCIKKINMSCDDLPDMDYYSSYVEGITYLQMFDILMKDLYIEILN